MNSHPPIQALRDIQGLDPISFWPLAPGWWILIAVVITVVAFAIFLRARHDKKIRQWQYQALTELRNLETHLTPETSQTTAISLSELVRKLAIHHYSRMACAGLWGDEWLTWLSKNDPSHFNWPQQARSLIEAPFSPTGKQFEIQPIKKVIHATRGWVR